jgi:DNA-binding response OmpR family regulator
VNVRLVTDDLLFGSKVEGMIREAGFVVGRADAPDPVLTVLDLTGEDVDAAKAVELAMKAGAPVLAYYAHTNDAVRVAALAAGVDKIVPRSRMMREGVDLIRQLSRN